jgi:glycosyltransferase involved in cell wall biosynthesis
VEPPYFLTVASTSVHKNLAGIVEAFALARREGRIPHRLVLCGMAGQSHGETLDLLTAEGVRNSVRFPGFVPFDMLRRLFRQATALLFLSLKEGFGLPPLEAMACGIPVIASDLAPMTEVVGDAGLRVDPTDRAAAAQAMVRLAREPGLRTDLAARATARVRQFSWDRAARETIAVYERTAEGA